MSKKIKHYTINLNEEAAEVVEALAKITRRKPAELLALIIEDNAPQLLADQMILNGLAQNFTTSARFQASETPKKGEASK